MDTDAASLSPVRSPLADVQGNTVVSLAATSSSPKSDVPRAAPEKTSQQSGDDQQVPSPSSAESAPLSATYTTDPPDLRTIQEFMVRVSAKPAAAHAVDGPPPYTFSGCDYALVLHACFPSKCVHLPSLCWSTAPLQAQLTGNLERFCLAARGVALAETPYSSLHAHLLQPVTANVLHHLKVQHWLFVLSRRFPPNPLYDAVSMRVFLRHQQLGFPALKRTRSEFEGGGVVVAVENAADGICASIRALGPFTAEQLAPCKPYVADVPPFTTSASDVGHPGGGAQHDTREGPTSANAPRGPSPTPTASNNSSKPKPWLSYSKPWRLPALEAAKAKKEAEEATAARRLEARRARDPCQCAFATQSPSLYEQYEISRDAARQLQNQLREIHDAQMVSLVRTGALDFAAAFAALEKAGIVPPTPRSTE